MQKKVMVVDHDEATLNRMRDMLSTIGYAVLAINDEEAVIKTVQKVKPDIILLAMDMPKKSGFQIAYELKHDWESRNIPLIGMGPYVEKEEKELYSKLYGIADYLKKRPMPLNAISKIEAYS